MIRPVETAGDQGDARELPAPSKYEVAQPAPLSRSTPSTKSIIVIGIAVLMVLLVSWWHDVGIVGMRWHSILSLLNVFGAYLLAVTTASALTVTAVVSRNRWLPVVVLTVFCVIVVFSFYASSVRANRMLRDEITACIAAGVEDDCRTVLDRYVDDPRLERDGYIRIFQDSDEYDSLPESIRAFTPVYVTIERRDDMPLCVGLCKNGFGGFHMGLRVFRSDPQIEQSPDRERVGSSTYLWIDET